jgi:hypothetical protein
LLAAFIAKLNQVADGFASHVLSAKPKAFT